MSTAAWAELEHELDAWRALGRAATLWWRDDDAGTLAPALERLLALREAVGVPLGLAVVPAAADASLARRLAREPAVAVLQHGYAHRSHAPEGERRQELGAHRPADRVADELRRGRSQLEALFARAARAVLVPPWNRIEPRLVSTLPGLGFAGLSALGPRPSPHPVPGLTQANVHVDLLDWRGGRVFIGQERALAGLARHLGARRRGEVDADEATGLLTHHLDLDEGCWSFLAELFERTRAHPAAHWVEVDALF